MNTQKKTCFKCEQTKDCSEFYAHPRMTDGFLGKCKECTKHDVRSARSDSTRQYDKRRYQERKHEHRARMQVNEAISRGLLVRPLACWKCGGDPPIEGHHADYNNPLGVEFLCKPCHAECHKLTTALLLQNGYAERLAARMDEAA